MICVDTHDCFRVLFNSNLRVCIIIVINKLTLKMSRDKLDVLVFKYIFINIIAYLMLILIYAFKIKPFWSQIETIYC